MTNNEMRDWIGKCMNEKGFHSEDMGFAEGGMVRSALVLTEVAEAMQEVKRHWGKDGLNQETVKDVIAEECADGLIRCWDLAYVHGIDLDADVTLLPAVPLKAGRHQLIVRLGRAASHAAKVYDVFEDLVGYTEYGRVTEEEEFAADGFGGPDNVGRQLLEVEYHLSAVCSVIGRDLMEAVKAKMEKNMARPWCYGTPDEGKVAN